MASVPAPPPGGSGVWAPGRRQLTTGLVLAVTLVAFESLSVATVLPVVHRHLGDLRLYGWVFSAFFLASLVGIVTAGALADRTGLAVPMAGGLTLFVAGLAIGGLAPDMPVLVTGRLVQGIGAGAVPASAYVAIGRSFPPEVRPRMFAVLSTAWVVPGLVGPGAAALIADHFGWRWVFLGLIPIVVVAAAIAIPAMARVTVPGTADHRELPIASAVLLAVAAGMVLAGLSSASAALAPALVVPGVAIGAVTLRRLTPAGTMHLAAGLPAAIGTRGLLTFAFFAGDAYVPLTLTSLRHTSTAFAGLALTVATVTWTAASWSQARLIPTWGPRRLIRTGLLVVSAGVATMATVAWTGVPVALGPVAWGIAGFGMGLAYAPISVTALDQARHGEEGRASAAVQLTDVLGTALGTGTAGAVVALGQHAGWAPHIGLGVAFLLALAVALTAAASGVRLPRAVRSAAAPA